MLQHKSKLDSRVRWQRPRFRKQLQAARHYRRPTRALPQTPWGVFLSKIGLGNWLSRFVSLSVLILLVYLVYVPNLFFVKNLEVTGTEGEYKISAQTTANAFLNKTLPWPQKNLLLLSKNRLKQYLLGQNKKIASVNSLTKDFPNTLKINVSPRLDEFLLRSPAGDFSLSKDGFITSVILPDASGTLPAGLLSLNLKSSDPLMVGQRILTQPSAEFLDELANKLPSWVRSPIESIDMEGLQFPFLTVYTQNGLKLLFDPNLNKDKTLGGLQSLAGQFSDADLKRVDYVDMRFTEKAYVCYKNTSCTADYTLPAATTTPENLTP